MTIRQRIANAQTDISSLREAIAAFCQTAEHGTQENNKALLLVILHEAERVEKEACGLLDKFYFAFKDGKGEGVA